MLDTILRKAAEDHHDRIAVVHDGRAVTYSDIYSDIIRLSKGLSVLGIKEGDCIALILPNRPEFITCFFAAARLNAINLLVNPALAENEIRHYIRDSKAIAIVTDPQRADICRNIIAEAEENIRLILTEQSGTSGVGVTELIQAHDDKNSQKERYKGDVVYQYSSGSTGRPKRVARTQKNLFHEASNFHLTTGTSDSDNILCAVPLFHAHGLGNCLLAAIFAGGTITILEEVKKDGTVLQVPFVLRRQRVLELIKTEGVTILPGVPFIFSALADTPNDADADLSSVRLCFSAGNFLIPKVFSKFRERFGIPVRQLYGCTEVGSFSINMDPAPLVHHDSVGQPIKNNKLMILDDAGKEVPPNTVGEIAIKSLALTAGYCNRPELNAEAFRDGFFLTGDLGKVDDKGRLYITGRKKIFFEVGGNKVDPLEIEDVLISHDKVKEVVVVGVQGAFGGESIKAVIVPYENCEKRDLILYCKDKLTSFKIPEIIEFRKEIPKSPLGKILRKDLI